MYNITDESQLIDIATIKKGCEAIKNTMKYFSKCGDKICSAAVICNKDALAIDDSTLEYQLEAFGNRIKDINRDYSEYADELYAQALQVYNDQKIELAEYRLKNQNN